MIDELINNKPLLYLTLGLLSISLVVTIVDSYNSYNYVDPQDSLNLNLNSYSNYVGLVKLGLAPSAPTRDVMDRDVYTGIKLKSGDNLYSYTNLEHGKLGTTANHS